MDVVGQLKFQQFYSGLLMFRWDRFIAVLLLLMLTACSDQSLGDLESFVMEVKSHKGKLVSLPVFEKVDQYIYQAGDFKDPFLTWKTQVAPIEGNSGGMSPDAQRQAEALEAFPLDTLKMKGILEIKGVRWGLVRASDGVVYRVKKDNYMGQNHGKITAVGMEYIELVEIVPNGLGGWERRKISLSLNIDN